MPCASSHRHPVMQRGWRVQIQIGGGRYVTKRVDELQKRHGGKPATTYFRSRDAEDYVLARW